MMSSYTTGPWEFDPETGRIDAVKYRQPTGHINKDGTPYIGGLIALAYGCEEGTHEANSLLIAAAPDLLSELQAAHQIIRNALAVMTTEQKAKWGDLNESKGVAGEGVTRANGREAVIRKSGGQK